MKKKYLIGLDNGGTIVKAGLYAADGELVTEASAPVESMVGKDGIVERDMKTLWKMNAQVIRETIEKADIDAADIAGLSICGHGNGIYLIDAEGQPVTNGIYSSDTRAKEYVAKYNEASVFKHIKPRTYQSIWAGQLTLLIAWFRDHQPEVLQKSKWALSCVDYIRYCLTGEVFGEITNMSGIGAMNLDTREYDDVVLGKLGISEYKHLLPPTRGSAEICGRITHKAAKETGLAEGTPVAGGLFDVSACAIATGLADSTKLCVIAGTWGINECLNKKPVYSHLTIYSYMDGYWMIAENSMTSATNLEWFTRQFMQEEKQQMQAEGQSVYEAANKLVASIPPEESSIIFLPYLFGTYLNPDAKACFLGVSSWHGKAHMLRAVYEGIVFSHMAHIEQLLTYREQPPQAVRIAGGVTKSKVWMQMFADVLQMPIEVSAVNELGTMGAAMTAGVATGCFSSYEKAMQTFTRIAYTVYPDAGKKDIYAKKYTLYKKVIGALDPVWREWN